jgi:hypothetical protein
MGIYVIGGSIRMLGTRDAKAVIGDHSLRGGLSRPEERVEAFIRLPETIT